MKKQLLIIFFLIFFTTIPIAFSNDYGIINEETTVWCELLKEGLPKSAEYAEIKLYNPSGFLSLQDNSSLFATGIYYYQYTFNESGNWLMQCDFYNETSLIGVASQSVIIKNGGVIDMETLSLFLIFAIGSILIFMGKFIGNYLYYFAGSVWFIINSYFALNNVPEIGILSFVFFVLVGIGSLWFGIDEVMSKKRDLSKIKEFNE